VLAVLRRHPLGPFLALYNVTDEWRSWPGCRLDRLGLGAARDLLAGVDVEVSPDGNVWLPPLASRWLVAR
jgi:amylosucrase